MNVGSVTNALNASDSSNVDAVHEIKALALRMATVVSVLESRSDEAIASITDSRQSLHSAASRLGQDSQRVMGELVRGVEASVRDCTERALAAAMPEVHAAIAQSARRVEESAQTLAAERAAFSRQQRSMLLVGAGALLIGSALAVGGASAWVAVKRNEAARFDFAKQIHEATAAGELAPCGDDLCVRVPENPRRAGERGEYLIVE